MLDLRTLALITAVTSVVFCFSTVVLWRLLPDQRSIREWFFASGLLAVGTILVALRELIPNFLSIVVGNVGIILGVGFVYIASRKLLGLGPGLPWHWIATAVALMAGIFFTYFIPNLPARVFLSGVFLAPLLLASAFLYWRFGVPNARLVMRVTALVLGLGGLIYLGRALVAFDSTVTADFSAAPSALVAFPYFYAVVFNAWMSIMLAMTVSAQIQEQLAASRDEAQATARELEVLSETDKLTQVSNRMRLDDVLTLELRRAQRHQLPLSVIMLDLDHFKRVNDAHGHPAGDAVLIGVAEVLRSCLRTTDTIGRWGGEEFLVILPHTSGEQALAVAEKIRVATESAMLPTQERITASLGVASNRDEDTTARIVNRADMALYGAKRDGRNRVTGG